MKIKNFQIPAVRREDEVSQIVTAIHTVPGVKQVTGHRATKIFTVEWDGSATWNDIHNTIEQIGYVPQDTDNYK